MKQIIAKVWEYLRLPLLVGFHAGLVVVVAFLVDGQDLDSATIAHAALMAALIAGLSIVNQELGRVITRLTPTQ